MFTKILVANRGEAAVRVIRACREMGIKTVAVYSRADEDALHTGLADEAVCIGSPRPADSYLDQDSVISAALSTGAQAIHPGYGFLSENAEFAALCGEYGLVFIGPPSAVISRMGDKDSARRLMSEAGVPVVPGSGIIEDMEQAEREAGRIGFPLLVKATAGGGGKGIREVVDMAHLRSAVETASAEAEAAFGCGSVYLERQLTGVRHVEVQLLCDGAGHIAVLGERDCSMQKNRQKLIEETPCPVISEQTRQALFAAAVTAARAACYESAGTVEFLLCPDGSFFFMEMNTRLQVEHPISEEVTGVDIVKWQIRIACGIPLPDELTRLRPHGCAIECRVNALSAGTVDFLHYPGGSGLHFATALLQGGSVPPYYDSMLGKLVARAENREECVRRLSAALCELVIRGVETNISDQLELIMSPAFASGEYNTETLSHTENGDAT